MKNALVSLFFALAAFSADAQSEKFTKAMESALAGMDTLKTAAQWQEKSNAFERIAQKEPAQWLPAYYVGFCQTQVFNYEKDAAKQEAIVAKADLFLAKADSLQPQNSEILVVKSMAAGLHIRLNPMVNGQKYGMLSGMAIEMAKKLDPTNPRVDLQQGITLFFTPEQWGGDKKKAKELMETAGTKFISFKPLSSIHPTWGMATLQYMLAMAAKG